jgi:hypothetical protein
VVRIDPGDFGEDFGVAEIAAFCVLDDGLNTGLIFIYIFVLVKTQLLFSLFFKNCPQQLFIIYIIICIDPKFDSARVDEVQCYCWFSLLIEKLILAQVHRLELRHDGLVEFFRLALEEFNSLMNLFMRFSDDLISQNDRKLVQ